MGALGLLAEGAVVNLFSSEKGGDDRTVVSQSMLADLESTICDQLEAHGLLFKKASNVFYPRADVAPPTSLALDPVRWGPTAGPWLLGLVTKQLEQAKELQAVADRVSSSLTLLHANQPFAQFSRDNARPTDSWTDKVYIIANEAHTPHNTTQHNTPHHSTSHHVTPHNTTQHHTTQHNTAQHNTA